MTEMLQGFSELSGARRKLEHCCQGLPTGRAAADDDGGAQLLLPAGAWSEIALRAVWRLIESDMSPYVQPGTQPKSALKGFWRACRP